MKKLPEIDLKELDRFKEKNFRERLEFQDMYIEWLKKTGNARWSTEQKSLINAGKRGHKKVIRERTSHEKNGGN
jgi:hypothetical protein